MIGTGSLVGGTTPTRFPLFAMDFWLTSSFVGWNDVLSTRVCASFNVVCSNWVVCTDFFCPANKL
jgi:hypothetical protein